MLISDNVSCSLTRGSFVQRLLLLQRCSSLQCVISPAEHSFDNLQYNTVREVAACARRLVVALESTLLLRGVWKYSLFDCWLLWQRYARARMLILFFCHVLAVFWMNGYTTRLERTLSRLPSRNHTEILQCKLHVRIWEKVMQNEIYPI